MSENQKLGLAFDPEESAGLNENKTGQQVIGALPHGSWVLGAPVPNRLPWQKVERMRRNETIAYIMTLMVISGAQSEWTVESDEDVPWEAINLVKKFIDECKTEIWESAVDGFFTFGWSPYELIFDVLLNDKGEERYCVRRLKPLLQETTLIGMDATHGFIGLQSMYPRPVMLPPVKSLVLTHERRGDNLFGRPIFSKAESAFDMTEQTRNNLREFDSKRKGPRYILHYPFGHTANRDNADIAADMVANLERYNIVALGHRPNTMASQMAATQSDWGIEQFPMESVSSEFVNQFMYYDKLLCRAFGIPERSVLEGMYGTKADASNGTDYAIMRIEYLVDTVVNQLNRYVVDRMLGLNYHGLKGKVRIVAGPIDKRSSERAYILVQELMNREWGDAKISQMVDVENIMEQSGIPRIQKEETNNPLRWANTKTTGAVPAPRPAPAMLTVNENAMFPKHGGFQFAPGD